MDRDSWCAAFAEVLREMSPATSRAQAEWTAQVYYCISSGLAPVEAVWVYLGLSERRQQRRGTESEDPG